MTAYLEEIPLVSRDDVNMKMRDMLLRHPAVVVENIIAFRLSFRLYLSLQYCRSKLLGECGDMAKLCWQELVETLDMAIRYDQQVARADRIQVHERRA